MAFTFITQLTHQGMIYVPLGYRNPKVFNTDVVLGTSPWGAGTVAGGDGSRKPHEIELDAAVTQGESFGEIVKKLAA